MPMITCPTMKISIMNLLCNQHVKLTRWTNFIKHSLQRFSTFIKTGSYSLRHWLSHCLPSCFYHTATDWIIVTLICCFRGTLINNLKAYAFIFTNNWQKNILLIISSSFIKSIQQQKPFLWRVHLDWAGLEEHHIGWVHLDPGPGPCHSWWWCWDGERWWGQCSLWTESELCSGSDDLSSHQHLLLLHQAGEFCYWKLLMWRKKFSNFKNILSEQSPGQTNQLLFSNWKVVTICLHSHLQTILVPGHLVLEVWFLQNCPYLFIWCLVKRIHIVSDSSLEEDWILRNDSNGWSQVRETNGADVNTINHQSSRLQLSQSQECWYQWWLPCSCSSNNSNLFSTIYNWLFKDLLLMKKTHLFSSWYSSAPEVVLGDIWSSLRWIWCCLSQASSLMVSWIL